MIGAVDQSHRDADDWKAERAVFHCIEDAFLDRWDVVARHHATGDLVLEYETGIARQRLDVEHHVAELTVSAGLLLVPAALLDRLSDGFAISDCRPAALDRDAKPLGPPLCGDA